jgi:hypothetical protein
VIRQETPDLRNPAASKSIVPSERHRPAWTVQVKQRFTVCPDDAHMVRAMVVRIDDHAQAAEAKNCGH